MLNVLESCWKAIESRLTSQICYQCKLLPVDPVRLNNILLSRNILRMVEVQVGFLGLTPHKKFASQLFLQFLIPYKDYFVKTTNLQKVPG